MMQIDTFRLERFFAAHEFRARHLLSASDCETWSLAELLAMASPESLRLWEELRFGYTESQGHPLLREEAAGLYERVPPENILIAVPEEAIFILMHSLVGTGDHAVVIDPAYQSLYEVARSAGCEVTRLALHLGAEGWHLDLDRVRRSLTDATRLLVVNFPHNPTGYLPPRREYDALVALARERGLYVLCDEMYRFLEHDDADRLPAACDVYEKAVSLGGLSKPFGLPGLRVGWLATRETALVERWLKIKDYTTICHSAPSEVLGIVALRARERILVRNRAIVRDNLAAARAFFGARLDLFRWFEPRGSSVAFPVWTGPATVEEFCRKLLEERGVMIAPGSLFDFPGNHFRVGMGRRAFAAALEQVAEAFPV